ncbi:perilipin 6 isoform X3 [Vanacampus margaritifer]
MGFGERHDMSAHRDHEMSAALRVSHLPLVRSALQSVTWAYSEAKGRYPLLGLVGGVAEVGVRNASMVALSGATPLIRSLGPQIEVANNFALVGLDQLERTFPVLNQSTDEVVSHLKDAFFLTLDDVQLWMLDGLGQLERLSHGVWTALRQLQDSQVGRAASSGLDEVLSRLESATAYYMPLPPTLRREWEMRVQEYEDQDDEDEPGMWTRVRSLLLCIGLQLYHRMLKVQEQLEDAAGALGDAVQAVGLGAVLDLLGDLLQYLQRLLVALLYGAESLREASLVRVREQASAQAAALAELRPLRQIRELPVQVRRLLADLRELAKILLQLLVNATPLYQLVSARVRVLSNPSFMHVEVMLRSCCVMRTSAPAAVGQRRGGVPESRGRLVPPQLGQQPVPEGHGRPSSPAQESLLQGRPQPGPRPPRRRPEAGPGDGRRRPTPSVRRRAHPHAAQAVCVAEPKGFRLPQPQRRRRVA